jgi:hypothetical protein
MVRTAFLGLQRDDTVGFRLGLGTSFAVYLAFSQNKLRAPLSTFLKKWHLW